MVAVALIVSMALPAARRATAVGDLATARRHRWVAAIIFFSLFLAAAGRRAADANTKECRL